jgi:signal transduction histidine kinase
VTAPERQRVAIETQVTGASPVAIAASRITTPSTLTAPFAAYIAHELRAPLSTQRALLELALADCDADTSAWREIAHKVLDACMQQERLLEACLVLTRSEAGLDRCELVDIASLTARLLRIADLEGLTVKVRLDRALTIGDEGLIERLLDNVLANAVRHNRAGGWIAITAGCSRSRTLFAIENTGDSIPADELTRLFQPFEQRRSPKGRPATGFGLGLAIVKAIADAHGASITARARPNGGLRVEVAFPLATRPRGHAALSRIA